MRRVLMDGSAVAHSARLLRGSDRLSAIHVFDLAILVESLILHEQVAVLETDGVAHPDLRHGRDLFEDELKVHVTSLERLVDDYVTRFAGEGQGGERHERLVAEVLAAVDEGHLTTAAAGVLLPWRLPGDEEDDEELDGYLDALADVYRSSRWDATPPGPGPRRGKSTARRPASAESLLGRTPHAHGLFGSDGRPGRGRLAGLAWLQAKRWAKARALVYLIASELLDAPYKADCLRWPLVHKLLVAGSPRDIQVDERLVRIAEDFEHRRLRSVNDMLGVPAVIARLPLLLRRILQESATVDEIPQVTLQIRRSDEARRFRECARQLSDDLAGGKVADVLRELGHYGDVLSRAYGSAQTDVYWTLLTQAVVGGTGGATPALAVDATRSVLRAGSAAWRWRARRRYALISKTVRQGRRANDLNADLERLFGARLHAQDLELLDLAHRLDHRS